MAKIIIKNSAEPSTPSSGETAVYIDPITKKLASKNDAGTVTAYDSGGGGGGTDELVKVSANDTTAGYLESKIVAGTGVSIATLNDGANETFEISTSGGGGSFPSDINPYLTNKNNYYREDNWARAGNFTGYNSLGWGNAVSGTGASQGGVTGSSSKYVHTNELNAGTANAGRASSYCMHVNSSSGGSIWFDGLAEWNYYFIFEVKDLGDGAGDDVQQFQGFGDGYSGTTTGNNYFGLYYESATSPNFIVRTRKASALSITTEISSLAVATQFYVGRLRFFLNPDDSDTPTCQAYLGNSFGTLVQIGNNITTNIPDTSANAMGIVHRIQKVGAGTQKRLHMIDGIALAGSFYAGRF